MDTDEQLATPVKSSAQQEKVRLGLIVAAALAVLTLVEYVIAVSIDDPLIWLLPFVIAKFALILEYFMHFSSVLGKGDH